MPDRIDVQNDAIRDGDTGKPLLTRAQADQARLEWSAAHPPIPGLRWTLSFGVDGTIRDRRLEVIPGWEDAFAPAGDARPASAESHAVRTRAQERDRVGALAYQGWASALPDAVSDSGETPWTELPEQFREPLRAAAVLVWQHAENAGFHQALLRTLPAAQLGAAGELDNLADFIAAMTRLHNGHYSQADVVAEIKNRVQRLREQADKGAQRARKQTDTP
jgi:hypothetical protein